MTMKNCGSTVCAVLHYSLCFITGEYGIVYKGRLAKGFNTAFSEVIAVKTLKGTVHTLTSISVQDFLGHVLRVGYSSYLVLIINNRKVVLLYQMYWQ